MPFKIKNNLEVVYGEMFQDDVSTTVSVLVQGDWYDIAGMSTGLVQGVTFGSAKQLTVSQSGVYSCSYTCSLTEGAGTSSFDLSLAVNGTQIPKTHSHVTIKQSNQDSCCSGTSILSLNSGDIITLQISNQSSTNDPIISHANVNIIKIG